MEIKMEENSCNFRCSGRYEKEKNRMIKIDQTVKTKVPQGL